jgi:hypothetical protein
MKLTREISLNSFVPWSGAVETLDRVREEGKIEELESTLEELYPDGMTDTELNDLLWFDEDTVFEWCDIENEEAEN